MLRVRSDSRIKETRFTESTTFSYVLSPFMFSSLFYFESVLYYRLLGGVGVIIV